MLGKGPILLPFCENAGVMKALDYAARQYFAQEYSYRTSAVPRMSGDGISRHDAFNRNLADHLNRYGSADLIRYFYKPKDEDLRNFVGNMVAYKPFRSQNRFKGRLNSTQYEILHVTGSVCDNRLKVAKLSNARKEYAQNQSCKVPQDEAFSLFDELEKRECFDDGKPLRIIVVTQKPVGNSEEFKVWLCVHDGRFDSENGVFCLAEAFVMLEGTISNPNPDIKANPSKADDDTDIDFDVTAKAS